MVPSPHNSPGIGKPGRPRRLHRAWRVKVWGLLALWVIGVAPATAENLRLQLAWGGDKAIAWQGRITLEQGQFSEPRYLGDEIDVVRLISVQSGAIAINSPSPRTYQSLEVSVDAELASRLLIELTPADSTATRVLELPLDSLLAADYNEALDENGSRLLIRRVPGDSLRVNSVEDHLVFSPNQRWALDVIPHFPRLPKMNRGRLQVRMVSTGSEQVVWRIDRTLNVDATGRFESARGIDVPIPAREGVYDLVLRLGPNRNRNLLLPTNTPGVERRIQFVVIENHAGMPPPADTNWQQAIAFDPAEPRWWERLGRFPALQPLSVNPIRLKGKGTASPATIDGVPVSRLEAGSWQAYPLPISDLGQPHILEVEYPQGAPNTLGVSVIEPGPNGPRDLNSRDVAVRVGNASWDKSHQICRMVFWPQTRLPYVWLSNLSPDRPAYFGRIRLLDGPSQLPAATTRRGQQGFRSAYAYLDRPQFASFFNARSALNTENERQLVDWKSFHEAGGRMVEYLRHCGLSGARLTCYCEGGAICPVPGAGVSARFDNGAYFRSGQDEYRKDVVEMLLRMFERDGLGMIVGLRFDAALPELEALLAEPQQATGIRLLDANGQPLASPRYNLLDPRVQAAIQRIVQHFVDRYGHHRSFAGIAIELDNEATGHLSTSHSGFDVRTVARFRQEMAREIQPSAKGEFSIQQITSGPLAPIWSQWRKDHVTAFYAALAKSIKGSRPDAQLVLDPTRLVESGTLRRACQPSLPQQTSVAQAMESLGLELPRLTAAGVVVSHPFRDESLEPMVDRGAYQAFSEDESWTTTSAAAPAAAATIYHAVHRRNATGVEQARLFGDSSLKQHRFQQIDEPATTLRSLVAALKTDDCGLLMMGGSQLPNLMSTEVQNWIQSFSQLPQGRFSEFESSGGHPVHLRTLQHAGRSYVYAVNDSPWKVRVTVRFRATATCQFAPLDNDPSASSWNPAEPNSANASPTEWTWQRELPPYGLAVGIMTDPKAVPTALSAELPQDVVPELQEQYSAVAARLTGLKRPKPYNVLQNPGFDAAPTAVGVPGWGWSREPGMNVQRDNQVFHTGSASLRLESQQPVAWVRSQPLAIPATGRLSVQAMVRFDSPTPTASLRIALEGVYRDQPWYRYAQVVPPKQEPSETPVAVPAAGPTWMPFMLHVGDLPTEGLDQLRVRFDLMGSGKAWVDEVRLFDLVFTPDEQVQLSRIVSLADYQLREGRAASCAHTLEQFWPQYLMQFASPDQPRVPETPRAPTITQPRAQAPSLLGRFRELFPPLLR